MLDKEQEEPTPVDGEEQDPTSSVAKKRNWVKGEISRKVFIDPTIELLESNGFGDVTTRKVAEKAGMDRSTIHQQFGSMEDLYVAVVDDLIRQTLATLEGRTTFRNFPLIEKPLVLRARLVAWMLANGTDPERLKSKEYQVARLAEQQFGQLGISNRTAVNFATLVGLLADATSILGPVYDLNERTFADGVDLLVWMTSKLQEIETDLKWHDPTE